MKRSCKATNSKLFLCLYVVMVASVVAQFVIFFVTRQPAALVFAMVLFAILCIVIAAHAYLSRVEGVEETTESQHTPDPPASPTDPASLP